MSFPTGSSEAKTIAYLDTDWKLATIYIAFMEPKTQQDAVRFIYGRRKVEGRHAPVIKQPVKWITEVRETLMADGFLVRTDNKLRGSIIKADISPILRSLQEAGAEGSHKPDVMKGAEMVLDSPWFRSFFSYTAMHTPMTYADTTIYEPYQNLIKIVNEEKNTKKLEINDLQNRIFQLLSEIGYYNHNFRDLMRFEKRSVLDKRSKRSILPKLIQEPDFYSFLENYDEEIPILFNDALIETIKESGLKYFQNIFCERLFATLLASNAGVFMPEEISILFRSVPCTTSTNTIDMGYIRKFFHPVYIRMLNQYEEAQQAIALKGKRKRNFVAELG
jgi:hypothetical protein